jgi:hypothetical protein
VKGTDSTEPCGYCAVGYYMPFARFERVATRADGPTFLNRCKVCGTLWHETLRDAARVSIAEALVIYPDAEIALQVDTVSLLEFKPENELEIQIVAAKQGRFGLAELIRLLTGSPLYVSSKQEVNDDGTGFVPLLLGECAKPLVAVFSALSRPDLHHHVAQHVLQMDGKEFFLRLPAGYGAILNPGYEVQLILEPHAVADLQKKLNAGR